MKKSQSPPAPPAAPALAALRFRGTFRKYQQMVLDLVERQLAAPQHDDAKYHIVAPPGAGKTIVGLELIRRFGQPAVVFAPTTTIQQQWQEKIGLFIDDPAWIAGHTSLEPGRLAEITCLTYQALSTPGEALEFVTEVALERWVDDLLSGSKTETEEAARVRIEALRSSNPAAFRAEIAKRYRRLKREILQRGEVSVQQFLHPNARDLIARLVAQGTGTVILDECHHLLDYWAFVLRALIQALPGVRVIGLTATLPSPENETEYENYTWLLGEVDFEVPTPAVVKEGNLAPYRDLVYFCEPSPREQHYLKHIQQEFETAIQRVTGTPAFRDWVVALVEQRDEAANRRINVSNASTAEEPAETDAEAENGTDMANTPLSPSSFSPSPPSPAAPLSFEAFFNREPLLCSAAVKVLQALGAPLPADVLITEEMQGSPTMDDWLTLLERFGLVVLKPSADPGAHALYRELRELLLTFGITLSERGIRHGRSPGDLVLALSEAKDEAVVEILTAEAAALGPPLRAVVITDYERLSASTRGLKGVLDADAGSAVRVFRRLVAAPVAEVLGPILVTGQLVLIDARRRDALDAAIRQWLAARGTTFTWDWQPTDDPRILQLVGSGAVWSSRTYVALLTALFEQGLTRCLVGTRGIFGEGWDALSLNTLIDLTAVTTSTGVQQIRGRSIRLDPAWPRKVAHNWDVVCVSRAFDKGDADLRRFVAKHSRTWGVVAQRPAQDLQRQLGAAFQGQVAPPALAGQIVRGVAHVDLNLARDLWQRPFKQIHFDTYTRRMLAAVGERDHIYDLWGVGQPYSNFSYSATHLVKEDLTFRTAYTVQESLTAMSRRLLVSLVATAAVIWLNLIYLGSGAPEALLLCIPLATLAALVGTLALNGYEIYKLFRRTFLELPADAVLLDMGRALLAALRDAGLVSHTLTDAYLRVVETEEGGYEVFVDYASPEDADTFARAYRELLGPLGDARYLIERDSASLRGLIYRPLWAAVRALLGLSEDLRAYHRVPEVLATRKERAEALARHWRHYVGGGRLIYTRTEEGRRILLQARARPRRRIRQLAFERWR